MTPMVALMAWDIALYVWAAVVLVASAVCLWELVTDRAIRRFPLYGQTEQSGEQARPPE